MLLSGIVTVEHAAEHSEHSPFFTTRATGTWSSRNDAVSETRERQCLENDAAWSGEFDEEQTFAAEQCGLHSRDRLNVIVDGRLECHEAAGIDTEDFTRFELHRVKRPAGMQEHEAVARELLQDESLAAEEAGTEPARERDAHVDAASAAEERVLLRDERSADVAQVDGLDLPGVWRGKRDIAPAV